MFNRDIKKDAIKELDEAHKSYENIRGVIERFSIIIFTVRKNCSDVIIVECENYINTLTNSPKEFEKTIADFKIEMENFNSTIDSINSEINASKLTSRCSVGAGTLAFTPTAAMAIATTFGTTSSLSGAAATYAALSSIGGGTLITSGAGSILLALSGPIGWGIGATALIGGGLLSRKQNAEIAKKAQFETATILEHTQRLEVASEEIMALGILMGEHIDGIGTILRDLKNNAPSDYKLFTQDQKQSISALINNINSLIKLQKKNVG
ncbi:hypothetical protein [Photobacterium carnosum]|uniref:hypothetical protein n=1 Tax=Photobacterium carnosum TaxID=2023717 RepID=UPI00128BC87F|nr:hypothetical protein [Photobacterium carnosum]KAE8178513.1 hypothetical protein CIT27_01725 [Photobacterium carnosum]MCD9526557.1 hypothetical protein [Photobacterium carnosum]